MLEVAYVANSTLHLQMGGQSDAAGIGGSGFTNINKIPAGGLFKPDPVTGAAAPKKVSVRSESPLRFQEKFYAG